MNGFLNDLHFGLRQLAAKPGFAVAAILTLALGIGANMAVFSLLNGYLLKPLPYPHGSQLVQIDVSEPKVNIQYGGVSALLYKTIDERVKALSGGAIYGATAFNLQFNGRATRVEGAVATASLFNVLQAKPLLGHTYDRQADQPGGGKVAVLSYALWQRLFGGAPDALGKQFRLNGTIYRVIGVMPRGFAFPDESVDLWMPVTITPDALRSGNIATLNYEFVGRTRPGATTSTVSMQLGAVRDFVRQIGTASDWRRLQNAGFAMAARPLRQVLVGDRGAMLWLLQGAVALVLLMACVNVANLLLTRVLGRTHELTMRAALGATRAVLARQLFVEAVCLTAPGGVVGIVLGWWALSLADASGLVTAGDVFNVTPDWRVGLFALGIVCVTALLVSLLPIRHLSRTDLQALLQAGGRAVSGDRRAKRLRGGLVILQLTLATALLAGAGLLLHSFINLQTVDTGFAKQNVLMAGLLVPRQDHAGDAALADFYDHLLTRVRTIPGVEQASLVSSPPLSRVPIVYVRIPGYKPPSNSALPSAAELFIGGDYFKALDIPILRGRGFDARDRVGSRPVAVINQQLARRYFGGTNPIGKQITASWPQGTYTVVGVVPTIKRKHLDEKQAFSSIYVSASQHPRRSMHLVLKTAVPPNTLIQPLRKVVRQADPAIAMFDVQTMQAKLADAVGSKRATMAMVIVFGGIALALAMIGVYGVLSYAVGQRRSECGVRLALGALPEDLLWLVIRDGLKLLAIAIVAGLGLAVAGGFAISSQLFGIRPFDPLTLAGAVVVLSAVTLLASYLPARRAAKLDPAIAMTDH
ncbi:MAG TPA: ABC transporter permease [Gammaproteobacteria bacterium]|nr:ABC transporter permease [Gammaproteobacteria bacterium]